MTDIREDLKKEVEKRKYMPYLTSIICSLAIGYGAYIVFIEDYLIGFVEPYLHEVPIQFVGWLLIISAILQGIGILIDCYWLRRVTISLLFGLWLGLGMLSIQFHFGTGFPDHNWMWQFAFAILTWRVVRKGDFENA